MAVYGSQKNRIRLCGKVVYSKYDEFTSATGDRLCSVRIPGEVYRKGRGYLEDRRPSSDCDPYLVCKALVQTCIPPPSERKEQVKKCVI